MPVERQVYMVQRYRRILFYGLWFLVIMLTACSVPAEKETILVFSTRADPGTESGIQAEKESEVHMITVYLCGEVKQPGVYRLPEPARLYQAVEAAGGMNGAAAADAVNLAQKLTDGEQINIPKQSELSSKAASGSRQDASSDLTDINLADFNELVLLPGIGEAKARAIIAWRETEGPFLSIEDIMKVPGIKESCYRQLQDRITVCR